VRRDIGQPLRVGEIALSARHVLHVLRVAEPQLLEQPFEAVVHALPVHARRFHRYGADRCVREELGELAESLASRGEALFAHLDLTARIDDATARDDRVPMDVEPGDPVSDPFHHHHLRQLKGGCRGRTWRSEI
jgi:hypothetical protein